MGKKTLSTIREMLDSTARNVGCKEWASVLCGGKTTPARVLKCGTLQYGFLLGVRKCGALQGERGMADLTK